MDKKEILVHKLSAHLIRSPEQWNLRESDTMKTATFKECVVESALGSTDLYFRGKRINLDTNQEMKIEEALMEAFEVQLAGKSDLDLMLQEIDELLEKY